MEYITNLLKKTTNIHDLNIGVLITVKFRFMVFNVTFNNISVISWWSVLLVEETSDLSQVTDKLYHIMLFQLHRVRTHNFIGDRH